MKKQHFAFILGGAWLAGMSVIASMSACSGDTTTTDSGPKDSTAPKDQSVDQNTQDQNNQDTGPGDSGTADCGSIPKLHVSEAGAIFCGYPADGGSSFSCTTGTQCCLGGGKSPNFFPEDCEGFGTVCQNPGPDAGVPSGIAIECNQNADCTANGKSGNVCCLQGAGAPALQQGCGYYKSQGGTAITCEQGATCSGATDIQICSADTDCPQGKTCTPMKWKLYQLGFCM